ncbi:LAFA_0D17128g1_1 [Lachancea sp. 'fantastica']|nr:LAFA_0D17128g1_1 [Lachancea sp. 'fantastica']
MVDGVSVAVGCAVGIPCGLAVVVAVVFWSLMQRRFRKEREEDAESLSGDGAISFRNMEALREERNIASGRDEQDGDLEKVEAVVQHAAEGSSSSDQTHTLESSSAAPAKNEKNEKIKKWGFKTDSATSSKSAKPNRRNTYMPAYRKRLNSSIGSLNTGELRTTNESSSTSLETKPASVPTVNEPTVLDQMIPVLDHRNTSDSALATNSEFSLTHDKHSSNDNLIKNLQTHDFGSYPRRRSSVNLNSMASANISSSSVVTRSSSTHSLAKGSENVFDTPTNNKTNNGIPNQQSTTEKRDDRSPEYGENGFVDAKQDYYMLKNNYDVKNKSEIAEEDQYENEFTNYTESKREFINSLKPRKR